MNNVDEKGRYVSLAEVKNILKKISKEREELNYEQRIALEHASKFARLSVKDTESLISDLMGLKKLEERHAYKIADILPMTVDEVRSIFAKERFTPNDNDVKNILDIVKKYISA
ncbi:MAG: RNA polymerase Rpb4 family protein [Candidatus Thermoplasmatota archaeon]